MKKISKNKIKRKSRWIREWFLSDTGSCCISNMNTVVLGFCWRVSKQDFTCKYFLNCGDERDEVNAQSKSIDQKVIDWREMMSIE